MTREEFMINALGADETTMMAVLNHLLETASLSFTIEEERAMKSLLGDPEGKMEVATILTEGARQAGVFGDPV